MANIDVLTTEEAIVANLMRNPDLFSKFKLKPEMFQDSDLQTFIAYVLDTGKVDVNQIYYKSREDKNFVSTQRLTKIFNSKGTEKVFFMNDQENILQEYVVNQSVSEMKNFLSAPGRKNLKVIKEQLSKLDDLKITKTNPTDHS